ncbi:AAA family ATPase [Cohnella herbarum]|uniref:AAA family ATPase n=1 Tax=Cohnella herbarum TaxID=2728023 RepID=A0A7Z2VPB8_9BACL|nr:AAA family ATPase [Cohnella herbarum]QJD86605.1 AAA family ATPase [Cohnella herbarum]
MVHSIHKRETVIGDLNPAGVCFQADLRLAELSNNRTLDYAYLSPEQTGRINRAPDQRSDLYALGMIFYEILAGSLPFQADTAEDWVYAHLTIVPKTLSELRPESAGLLESIIMKLLAKMPGDRYQSAYGLLTDLQQCDASIRKNGEIVPFAIAREDEASRFRLPPILFGRETEVDKLHGALERARSGGMACVVVSGRAGSGKTALVRKLRVPVIKDGGQYIAGKCDLMNRDIPFSPILQALRSLIRQVWSESPETVEKLRVELKLALGQGAGVIVQLLPEAAKLLGELRSVEQLAPAEAAIRFRRLLPIFIQVFASREHPLVIFLDDLQWADPATMDVLCSVVFDSSLHHLLIIGAFRDESAPHRKDHGETQADAELWIDRSFSLSKSDNPLQIEHIALLPLSYIDVRHFISHLLNENSARIRLLAEFLYHRTGGDPLYLHRLLDSLYREKKLYYCEDQAVWKWDEAVVAQMPEDPDILELIATRIRMLPPETIELLVIAAAIGHRYHPSTVALVSGRSLPHIRQLLHSVEEEGLLSLEKDSDAAEAEGGYFTFLHDRVQQVAYQMIPETEHARLHLKIGRVMRDHSSDIPEQSIFDKVYHLNLGSGKMTDEAERTELAGFNLQAGLKSKATTAYEAALHFLKIGLDLARDDGAETDSLAYRIMLEMPECEYMCGRVDRAEELLESLMARTADQVERSRIYLIRITMNAYLKRDSLAVGIGLQALAEFGWKLSMKPSTSLVVKEVAMTQIALNGMRNKLPNLPVNHDSHYKALSELVKAMSTSVFTLSLELSAVLFSRFVRYGLKHGNNEAFAYILAGYGLVILRNKISFFQTGLYYINTAFRLSASLDSADLLCRLHYIMGLAVLLHDPDEGVEHLEQSVRYGMESANLTYVNIAMLTSATTHVGNLDSLSARLTTFEDVPQQLVDKVTLNIFRIARWYLARLQGLAGENDEVAMPVQNERFEETLNHEVYYTCSCKIEISYLFGRYDEALEWVEQGKFNTFRQTRMQVRKQHVYHSLTLAAIHSDAPPEERKGIRDKLAQQLQEMKKWSDYYGRKSSACLLVKAELQRIDGNRVDAARGYEDAIREARSEGNRLIEAISCERASLFYREAGSTTGADILLADACDAYSVWGATAKARKLREANPELEAARVERQVNRVTVVDEEGSIQATREIMQINVDEKTLIKKISEWARSEDSHNVMHLFLESAISYSGAEQGYVLNSFDNGLSIENQLGERVGSEVEGCYADAIVRYVVKTGESVVLSDASRSAYAADPYIRSIQPKSVLCMPVLFPGQSQSSVLYLENNLIPGVFTSERLEVLDLMITRMVYLKSLEDSRTRISATSESGDSLPVSSVNELQPLLESLSNREAEILYALADGLSNKEVAFRFGLTEGTVKNYLFHLYSKLGVKRRAQAIARARELGILD